WPLLPASAVVRQHSPAELRAAARPLPEVRDRVFAALFLHRAADGAWLRGPVPPGIRPEHSPPGRRRAGAAALPLGSSGHLRVSRRSVLLPSGGDILRFRPACDPTAADGDRNDRRSDRVGTLAVAVAVHAHRGGPRPPAVARLADGAIQGRGL